MQHINKQRSLSRRIVASFGIILIVIIAIAVVAGFRLVDISRQARNIEQDSMSGVYEATTLRSAWFEHYSVAQRLLYTDIDPDSIKRDLARLSDTDQGLDKAQADYSKTVFGADETADFNAFIA